MEITINLLRISPNGQHMEYSIVCPTGYTMSHFYVTVRYNNKKLKYDVASVFTTSMSGSIPLNVFDIFTSGKVGPAIYEIQLVAASNADEEVTISAPAVISDINHVYECMYKDLQDVCKCANECSESSNLDSLIRKYFVLYGHTEAMRLGYLDEADMYFNMLNNCLKCGSTQTTDDKCAGSHVLAHPEFYNASTSSCGCGR